MLYYIFIALVRQGTTKKITFRSTEKWDMDFVEFVEAEHSSKNRLVGTLQMKPIDVHIDVHTTFIVNKVFPNIRAAWEYKREGTIEIPVG